MNMIRLLIEAVLLLAIISPGAAATIDERADLLYTRFMPPCCFTGLLKDHHSAEAEEMKNEIRSMLQEGTSEKDIIEHYVSLHGERILSQPPGRGFNRLALLVPILAVGGGALLVGALLRRQKARAPAAPNRTRTGLDAATDERIEQEIREGE
jgi:cytochrome c-type biogenesis protein CcmH